MSDQGFFQSSINVGATSVLDVDSSSVLGPADTVVAVDTTGGAAFITLPPVATVKGERFTIISVDSTANVTVRPISGESVDGTPDALTVLASGVPYNSSEFVSIGTGGWVRV